MPKSRIGHVLYGIDMQNSAFYRDLFNFLGWKTLFDDPAMLGLEGESGASAWFGRAIKTAANDYDGPGLNHLALYVERQSDVDEAVAYLRSIGVQTLFGTPCHRPDFAGPGSTYYQVMFESPDRLLLEIVYYGKSE